ncbi:MAG: prolyl oligopeptidase family serine peptidase [Hyphomonas sp.]|nr:prolyl oligopeptidase family serine peptidase [Hyphomonas sp.]
MSLDDMMKVEGFGAARIDPDGRWLVYEQVRPYDQLADYSFRTYAFQKTGHQLWRYDLEAGGKAERLPGIDPAPSSFLEGFSPGGRYLAVQQYWFGDLVLSAYDMQAERQVKFGPTPAFSRVGHHTPVWINAHEMVFTALPDGELPEATSVRAFAARVLTEAWNAAFRGKTVTGREVRTKTTGAILQPERGSLVRADATTGETRVIAEGLYADLRAAPGGRWLAGLAVSEPSPIEAGRLIVDDRRRYSLTLFDLSGGAVLSPAEGLEFFPYSIVWSPDGRRLAAFGWQTGADPGSGRFHVMDLETGKLTAFEHQGLDLASERERGSMQRPERAVFFGESLAVFARPADGGSASPRFTYRDIRPEGLAKTDWYSVSPKGETQNLTRGLEDVSPIPVSAGDGQLTVLAGDGLYRLYTDGSRRRITPELEGTLRYYPPGTFAARASLVRPEFRDEALLELTGAGSVTLIAADLRQGHDSSIVLAQVPADQASPVAGSPATGAMVYRAETGPASALRVVWPGGPPGGREIAKINTHLTGIDLGKWEIVSYTMGGQTIESCVLLPPGFDPASPPPLIVDVYPGTRPTCTQGGPKITYADPHSPYLWAGKGYAYARLTTPSSLIRTPEGPIAGMKPVIDAGIDALAQQGFADPDRLVLHGYSQGGATALYMAAFSVRFKAVIAKNGWADFFSHYFGAEGVYAYLYPDYIGGESARYDSARGSDFGIGRTPFEDPDVYYRNSPVFLANSITAPVLLIHSDMDAFAMSQFDEMYGALLRAGKDARYVRYWGEGHGPSSPANIRDMWSRTDAFLAEQAAAPR